MNSIEVKFIGNGDTSRVYDVTTFSGAQDLGNGWFQLTIPLTEFAGTIAANDGFLLGPLGDQGAPFTFLLTDIGFAGTAPEGGGDDGGSDDPNELAQNGSFETGDLTGWSTFTNDGQIDVEMTDATDGQFAVHVVSARGQNPTVKQERRAAGTVMPGDLVNISFDMRGSLGAGGVIFPEFFSERESGGATNEILETITAVNAGWTSYQYMATAGDDVSGGITFQIGVVCGDVEGCFGDVFIDNVSMRLAP
ncbi:MAG: carbohydrate binding domain-containing protein [Pseudomonadota bacterium]